MHEKETEVTMHDKEQEQNNEPSCLSPPTIPPLLIDGLDEALKCGFEPDDLVERISRLVQVMYDYKKRGF